jgi:hypothetical protein
VRDVRFFLRAFESDLSAEANSTLEQIVCGFFRRRIRYFSSQICEHFHLGEYTAPDVNSVDGASVSGSMQQLEPITIEDPDPTLMPAFSIIRNFMFDGVGFRALKENVENFAERTRDYNEEVADIIIRNIHPPVKTSVMSREEEAKALHVLLGPFLCALGDEAKCCRLSASDRAGIRCIQSNVSQLSARVSNSWIRQVPLWHFYPSVLGSGNCVQSDLSPMNETNCKTKYELFEVFVCSSRGFLDLARSVAVLPYRNKWRPQWPTSRLFSSLGTGDMSSSSLRTAIAFECVSLSSFIEHSRSRG